MKYLVVDDNDVIRGVIRQALSGESDTVAECPTGDDALAVYEEVRPDYVLLDIQMPGKDGIQTARELKQRFPDARIIIVTEFDTPAFRKAALKAGAHALVSKEEIFRLKDMLHNVEGTIR